LVVIPPAAPGVDDEPGVSVHETATGSKISAELLDVNATGVAGVPAQAAAALVRPPA
jgi:hypothetical protein